MPLEFHNMPWRVTNDDVMGGLSQSRSESSRGGLLFEGELSRENNGGFASVLGTLDSPVRNFAGGRMTVSGDGRRYQVRLRQDPDSRTVAWRAHFQAGAKPTRIALLPDQFDPVIRGEPVIGAPLLPEADIRYLGFMLAGEDPGPFRLVVHDVEFCARRARGGACLVVGASRGIGLALVTALLAEPAVETVIATHRRESDRSGLDELAERHGNRLLVRQLDITESDSVDQFARFMSTRKGGVDLAIHAAGILHEEGTRPEKSLAECRTDRLGRMFEVNSIGPLMTARTLLPLQPRNKPFTFAALSAMVGSIGDNRLGGWYGYRASKAALNQFVRTLANECRVSHPGAAIVALHPGTTDTALTRPFQRNIEPDRLYTPETTATRILDVIDGLGQADSGRFLNWDGTEIPW